MSGITGYVSETVRMDPSHRYFGAIDLLQSGNGRTHTDAGLGLSVCVPSQSFLHDRFIEHPEFIVAIAGFVVSGSAIEWSEVAGSVRDGSLDCLDDLSGRFALTIFDKTQRKLHLVTDRIAQFPFYLLQRDRGVFWSTSQASFTRLDDAPDIRERWLHEFILCNFSPTHASFLQGVTKLPAASVTTIDIASGSVSERQYSPRLEARPSSAPAAEEVDLAKKVFASRAPLYLLPDEKALLGVTSGFDSRVILASFMDTGRLETYTYGIPGSADLATGKDLTDRLDLRHTIVNLDDSFESKLPDSMVETVWLSSGLQTCIRSSLLHAYRSIAARAPDRTVLLTGTSGDQLFRGGGNVPSIVSRMIEHIFMHGSLPQDLPDTVSGIFESPEQGLSYMQDVRDYLVERYGDPTKPSAHLGYLTYEVPAGYFAGEGALAEHFFDYRTPFCDREILDLAWSFRLSTLDNSRFLRAATPNRKKNYLHACLVSENPRLARQPIQDRPLWAYTRDNAALYYAWAAAIRIRQRLSSRASTIPLEDWPRWFAGPMRSRMSELLGDGSHIREYVRGDYIDACLSSADTLPLNKLVTLEIILRLARNGWDLDRI